jgi:hypothetical protein
MHHFFPELFLQATRGSLGELGNLDLIYWLKAMDYPLAGRGMKGTIASRMATGSPLTSRDWKVSLDEVKAIVALFRWLGDPGGAALCRGPG